MLNLPSGFPDTMTLLIHDYLKASMGPLNREEFRLLYLNRSKHLISEEVLFKGTVDIPILDHVVIGRNSFLSMKRRHPDIFEGENDIA